MRLRFFERMKRPMPPRWKVQRELHRVWLQIKGLAEPFTGRVLKPLYDRSKGKKIKITEGAVPLGGDVAVFLIYAPGGFPRSLFRTLEHLKDTGFSTLVVANHPLSDEDRQQLAPYTWRIMSRPNVGYDFGGYREGILHLIDEGITPDNLLVLNDSMWFPLLDGDTMLDDMRKWPENIRGFSTDRHKRSNLKPFVQSFLFMYDREIVASPEFAEYWRSIVLSNNKNVVIRKLEMGMSVHFANLGFDVRSLHDYSRIGETLAALPKDRQIRFLEIEAPRLNGHGEQAMARP